MTSFWTLVLLLNFWTGPTAVQLVPLQSFSHGERNGTCPTLKDSGRRVTAIYAGKHQTEVVTRLLPCCMTKNAAGRQTDAIHMPLLKTKRVVKVSFAGFTFITDSQTHLKMMLATVVLDP